MTYAIISDVSRYFFRGDYFEKSAEYNGISCKELARNLKNADGRIDIIKLANLLSIKVYSTDEIKKLLLLLTITTQNRMKFMLTRMKLELGSGFLLHMR